MTLCLCHQHFHNNFMFLNAESMLDPVTDILSTHGTTKGPIDFFFFILYKLRGALGLMDQTT